MTSAPPRRRWLPILLAILVADLNFWYYASMGENDADYAGIALFSAFAVAWLWRWFRTREPRTLIAAGGALAADALMVLRETGKFDRGYIPPYVVFVLFALLA